MSILENGVQSWFKKENYRVEDRLDLVDFYINIENRIINRYLQKEGTQNFIQLVKTGDTETLSNYYTKQSGLINKIYIPKSHEKEQSKLDNSFKFCSIFMPNKNHSNLSCNGVYTMCYYNLKNQVDMIKSYISNRKENSKEKKLLNLQESINFAQKAMTSIKTADSFIKYDNSSFDNKLIEIQKLKLNQVNDILYNPTFTSQHESSTVLLELDLSKTDKDLKMGFDKVLKNIRKINPYDIPVGYTTTESKIDDWMKAKVFEYIDILYWVKFKDLNYSQPRIAKILFSGTDEQNKGALRTTKKHVNMLMNVNFINKLRQEITKG